MTTVEFASPRARIDVQAGTSLLRAARAVGAPVGSTCGGACACSGCHVVVQEGAEHLSEMDDDEETILTAAFAAQDRSRLACQSQVVGSGRVVVAISEESRRAYAEQHARAG
ncbi:MAG: (2Fe-2S)-binding protein [Polyangiaceae bacterium]|jgi:2Fe-2S ferredoxin|nr:(2Fe-2S)-binding protein [Polyangiaceae bacterium]